MISSLKKKTPTNNRFESILKGIEKNQELASLD